MNLLEKMKLVKSLNQAVNDRNAEMNPLKKMELIKQVIVLRKQLGLVKEREESLLVQNEKEIDVSQSNHALSKSLNTQSSFEAARSYFREKLQGKFVNTQIGKVWLIGGSWREMKKGMKKDEIKAHLIPFVPQILKGHYDGQVPSKKMRNDEFSEFHSFSDSVKLESLGFIVNARIIVIKNPATQQYEFYAYSLHYDGKNKESYQLLDSSQSTDAATQVRSPDYVSLAKGISRNSETFPCLDNVHLDENVVNNDGWNIEIISITDLDGNPISLEDEPQTVVNPTDLFNYNPQGITQTQRQAANNAAIEIVQKVQRGELNIEDITPEQKIILSTYSGSGGGLTTAEGTRGSSYEYYTPKPIAQGMWDLLTEMGFNGGKVLDPCAGTGIFSATAPQNVLMESIELDQTSGTINQILFNDDSHKVTISPFEAVAAATEDEIVDAVITNVPFGDNRGGNQFKDSRYQKENLESYFILRSLDKLRPNGLAVFMSGTGIMTGTRYRKIRHQISLKAEFMGAYRLPNKLFETAGADVVTDVLVFKKHSRPNKLIIDELANLSPETLKEANVLWETFISGRYFKVNPQYILGTESKVRSKYGEDVLAVMSDESIANIAKLLRRFEGSRIDWALLNTAAEPVITYQEGETLYFDGVLKEYKKGAWVNAKLADTKPTLIDDIYTELEQYHSPLVVIERDLDLNRLLELIAQVRVMGLDSQKIPQWVRGLMVSARNHS
ncbi:N-6 DNA methylase [Avibacterium paragallinarum]|uniref:N-6 DNA methylase n=1 Tax=Avibacterium paragallinarum TaxID=728 RepID=UPI00102A8344|nr:N-6 DNA methylase [Avibacterium paragallinarum]RZN74600.1 hypothetical protein EC523_11860 [Avibacterium paragallinarum]